MISISNENGSQFCDQYEKTAVSKPIMQLMKVCEKPSENVKEFNNG